MSSLAPHGELTVASPPHTNAASKTFAFEDPAFVCTICWQDQPPGSKPKLLGTSARIVCHACWCAVLNLSICWVCGECIVRGDEVVSLGWCFWHRSCFGCLFCKTKMAVPQTRNWAERRHERTSAEEAGGGKGCMRIENADVARKCVGVELEEVPLCSVCKIQCADDHPKCVIQKGLETVTKFDGGLSRNRFDMLVEGDENEAVDGPQTRYHTNSAPQRIKGHRTYDIECDLRRYVNDGSNDSFDDASTANTFMSEAGGIQATNGSLSSDELSLFGNTFYPEYQPEGPDAYANTLETHTHSDSEETELGYRHSDYLQHDFDEDIYVSIFNPLKQPSFRASTSKPLPHWMRLLPNNVHRERGDLKRIPRAKSLDSVGSLHDMQTLVPNTPIALAPFENPLEDPVWTTQFLTTVKTPTTRSSDTITPPASIHFTLIKPSPKSSCTTTDRLPLPESTDVSDSPDISYSLKSSFDECELKNDLMSPGLRTPTPRMSHLSPFQSDTSSHLNHCTVVEPRTIFESLYAVDYTLPPMSIPYPRRSDNLSQQIQTWTLVEPPVQLATQILQSGLSLERCQPEVVLPSYCSKLSLPKPEPILEKIRKQRNERKRFPQEKDGGRDKVGTKQAEQLKWGRSIVRLDGNDPRSNLHQELRNLFCEQ